MVICANEDAIADCFDEERAETPGEALALPVRPRTPTLIYGHERCVLTEKTRLHIQASKMRFLPEGGRAQTSRGRVVRASDQGCLQDDSP